ncbi:MAG: hypothetical protein A2284_14110 [Deltaproteobacteria bacterium RIFOXYA12_FULL_61_11]|nr:MAG: hypothetical protein A2284_14110 [Deltaproteobacteria bacterium RIFOXYA12_FULL_61_11]
MNDLRDRIERVLLQAGMPLTLEEILDGLLVADPSLRQRSSEVHRVLQRWTNDLFVTTSDNRFALTLDLLAGARFRITPRAYELEEGILELDGGKLFVFWPLFFSSGRSERLVRLQLEGGLVMERPIVALDLGLEDEYVRYVLPDLTFWYRQQRLELGDDLLIQVLDRAGTTYAIRKFARTARGERAIQRENRKLADVAFSVLKNAGERCEAQPTLMRMVFGRYPHKGPTIPDMLDLVLAEDSRFNPILPEDLEEAPTGLPTSLQDQNSLVPFPERRPPERS